VAWVKKAIDDKAYGKCWGRASPRRPKPPGWGHQHFFERREIAAPCWISSSRTWTLLQFCLAGRALYATGYRSSAARSIMSSRSISSLGAAVYAKRMGDDRRLWIQHDYTVEF